MSNENHKKCECHECTQARYRSSMQYQIDCALRPRIVEVPIEDEDEAAARKKILTEEA